MDLQVLNQAFPEETTGEATRTLAEFVTVRLRAAILLGRLQPGTRLSQDTLARQLGVSRVPLREALKVLEAEGLVEWRAHRAAIVTGLSAEDLAELYALGASAEAAAVAQATHLATDAHIQAIGALVGAMENPDITPADWHTANRQFHAMLVEPAKWSRFQRIISDVRANSGRYVKAYLQLSGNIYRWREDHQSIYHRYRDRDAAGAAEAVRRHWMNTSDTLQQHLSESAARETALASEE